MPKSNSKVKNNYQPKNISSTTMQKFVQFLARQAEVKRKLEIIKQMLAEQENFTPASLFHRIDYSRNGVITERDLQNFLKNQNLNFKGSQIKILFGLINTNKNVDIIYLRQFQNFILPNQNPRLRYVVMRRPVVIPLPGEQLSQKIQWITTKLFSQSMDQYTKLKQIHQSLLSSFDFDAEKIFQLVSRDGKSISGSDLIEFFQVNGTNITTQQIGCLIRHMDRKGEGIIEIQDFKFTLATLGIRKQHQIFDQLSPIPTLKQYNALKKSQKSRGKNLKGRYEDNLSYQYVNRKQQKILGYVKGKSSQKLNSSRKHQ